MFTILLHSSKTTRQPATQHNEKKQVPILGSKAEELARYLKTLSPVQIQSTMKVSEKMAEKIYVLLQDWHEDAPTLPAIDLFLGDIYSGLQAQDLTPADRRYANDHLFILSGLYGILRALDDIQPYRLEMGYKLPGNSHDSKVRDITNLYAYWGNAIADQLPKNKIIINLSAVEYTKAVLPYVKDVTIITPRFLTLSPKTQTPVFVTVHAKIARGAFARWLIQSRITDINDLKTFNEIGYQYDEALSTADVPVFVAIAFKGTGLSVRTVSL